MPHQFLKQTTEHRQGPLAAGMFKNFERQLQTSSSPTTLSTSAIGGNWGHILCKLIKYINNCKKALLRLNF